MSREPERRSTNPGLSYHDWHMLGPLVKGNCFPGYLQKKNSSDPLYIMSLTSYHLSWRKCVIQQGESSLFTLSIYSLCCEFFLLRQKGFQSTWTSNFAVLLSAGKCLCFGNGESSVRSSKLSFQHCCYLCSCLGISQSSLCKPLGFLLSDSVPNDHSFGAGQSLVFSVFLQYSI